MNPDAPIVWLGLSLVIVMLVWFRDRSTLTATIDREAEARRDLRIALAYIATKEGNEALFAGALLGGHHQIISRHYPDFAEFRAREIERLESEFETDG